MTQAVFAIPGDKDRRTGGFIYEARVLDALNDIGCDTAHLRLPDTFPDPTGDDMIETLHTLAAISPDTPIILDGLVFGAIDPDGLGRVHAPVIAMIHHPLGLETGLSDARATFLQQNEAAALRHAAHVMVPSPDTARVLQNDYGVDPARVTVASPGFDRPHVDPVECDPPLILSVGLLAPRKGHDVLLDALAQIRDLPWQAEIVGNTHDPAYADTLGRQAKSLGIDARVVFTGELSQIALNARFNAASVFALATRYEGYGMVLSEAMMFGLPVVSCDAGAVKTTIGNAGLIVPTDDAAAFAAALRRILNDPGEAKRLSDLSRAKAASLPNWQDTARIFQSAIMRLRT